MSDFVRIKTENGREVTVGRAFAESLGSDVEIIDAPATNGRGLPIRESRAGGRRAKPKTTVKKEAAKKATSKSAPSEPGEPTSDGVAVVQPQEASE